MRQYLHELIKLKPTWFNNKVVGEASSISLFSSFVDTSVDARVLGDQIADGDVVLLQSSIFRNPVWVSVSCADSFISHSEIVQHLLLRIKTMIQIHPQGVIDAADTFFKGALQGDILSGLAPHYNVPCDKNKKTNSVITGFDDKPQDIDICIISTLTG